jgi:hypothetical protein
MKIAVRMLIEKCVIDRVLCRLQMGVDAGDCHIISLKFSHPFECIT